MWGALALLLAAPAAAHPAQATALLVDVGAERVQLSVEVPRDQLGMALRGSPAAEGPLPTDAELSAYVLDHLSARAGGQTLPEQVLSARWDSHDGQPTFVVAVDLPAEGADLSVIELESDLVIHTVVSHKAYVYLRRDAAQGQLGEARVLGVLKRGQTRLQIDRTAAAPGRAVAAAARMGAHHIAEGVDHLMFLLCLVVVAPLQSVDGRWTARSGLGAALRQVGMTVTAFTAGHSLTLALAALGVVTVPSAPVEVLIALSIALTAAHTLRPLFPAREGWVAGGFGLIHGLAFATALSGLGFDPAGLLWALAGFNLGVEAGQLAAVCVALPALALVAAAGLAQPLRQVGGLVALAAGIGWAGERALGLPNPVAAHPLAALAAALITALLPPLWMRLRRG
jgi:hypothetical protein